MRRGNRHRKTFTLAVHSHGIEEVKTRDAPIMDTLKIVKYLSWVANVVFQKQAGTKGLD